MSEPLGEHQSEWDLVAEIESADGWLIEILHCTAAGAKAQASLGAYRWEAQSDDGMRELEGGEFDTAEDATADAKRACERADEEGQYP